MTFTFNDFLFRDNDMLLASGDSALSDKFTICLSLFNWRHCGKKPLGFIPIFLLTDQQGIYNGLKSFCIYTELGTSDRFYPDLNFIRTFLFDFFFFLKYFFKIFPIYLDFQEKKISWVNPRYYFYPGLFLKYFKEILEKIDELTNRGI